MTDLTHFSKHTTPFVYNDTCISMYWIITIWLQLLLIQNFHKILTILLQSLILFFVLFSEPFGISPFPPLQSFWHFFSSDLYFTDSESSYLIISIWVSFYVSHSIKSRSTSVSSILRFLCPFVSGCMYVRLNSLRLNWPWWIWWFFEFSFSNL